MPVLDYRRTHQHLTWPPTMSSMTRESCSSSILPVRHGTEALFVQQLGYLQRGALNVVHTVASNIPAPRASSRRIASANTPQSCP